MLPKPLTIRYILLAIAVLSMIFVFPVFLDSRMMSCLRSDPTEEVSSLNDLPTMDAETLAVSLAASGRTHRFSGQVLTMIRDENGYPTVRLMSNAKVVVDCVAATKDSHWVWLSHTGDFLTVEGTLDDIADEKVRRCTLKSIEPDVPGPVPW